MSQPMDQQASGAGRGEPAQRRRRPLGRRDLLALVSLGLGGIGAAIIGVPFIGVLVAPLLRPEPGQWRTVGNADSFAIGSTTAVTFLDSSPLAWAGPAANTAAWLRRVGDSEFEAFAVNCTHLGCPVRWIATANLFMCPCHGGVFYANGQVAAGPPQHPLVQYPVRVVAGEVQIQTSAVPIE